LKINMRKKFHNAFTNQPLTSCKYRFLYEKASKSESPKTIWTETGYEGEEYFLIKVTIRFRLTQNRIKCPLRNTPGLALCNTEYYIPGFILELLQSKRNTPSQLLLQLFPRAHTHTHKSGKRGCNIPRLVFISQKNFRMGLQRVLSYIYVEWCVILVQICTLLLFYSENFKGRFENILNVTVRSPCC
jgi:hypothetical protein